MKNKIRIGVIGGSSCSSKTKALAEQVGQEIAKAGAILVCGGLGGVMEAACRGARQESGITIGILPTLNRESANPYVDVAIVTGLGEMRNLLVVRNSDAIIALEGKYGTLSEIAFCLNSETPVVSLFDWDVSSRVIKAEDPEHAVKLALREIAKRDD